MSGRYYKQRRTNDAVIEQRIAGETPGNPLAHWFFGGYSQHSQEFPIVVSIEEEKYCIYKILFSLIGVIYVLLLGMLGIKFVSG